MTIQSSHPKLAHVVIKRKLVVLAEILAHVVWRSMQMFAEIGNLPYAQL